MPDYWAGGSVLPGRSSCVFPSGAFQLEVTVGDEVCMEIPAAVSEALVKGNRAAQAREG